MRRDWGGVDCVVASRQGLFGVSGNGVETLIHGFFFGTAAHEGAVYLFEACDRPANRSPLGRIVRIALNDGRVEDAGVLVGGLDTQCHQIAVIDGLLLVVDTAGQCIRRFTVTGEAAGVVHPLDADAGYRHINSIAEVAGRTMLVLHNGVGSGTRPSERAVLDAGGRATSLHEIAGHGCHDIWTDAAGAIWHCGSMAGELVREDGYRVKVSDRMTRGVARLGPHLLVGTSLFGTRSVRDALGGSLLTLDETYRVVAEVRLPGAPTTVLALPRA